MSELPKLSDFPAQTYDKLRYGDTDRQGHVNNAVFATFFETGRTDTFQLLRSEHLPADVRTVIARLLIDFRAEIFWPGTVEIGSAVKSIGNSSLAFVQALYQNGKCVATAESVLVRIDPVTRRSMPFTEDVRAYLSQFIAT
jgi:acyl-CoA thioester hydrolase